MKNFSKSILDGDFVIDLLVVSAVLIFGVQFISMLPTLAHHVGTQPGVALLNTIIGIIGALFNPAILLGLAKLISLKKG